MKPSANTPAVCVTVTIPPSATASRGRPRVPTRYAATIALPWPGESAWIAPQAKAVSSRTISRRSPSRMPAKPASALTVATRVSDGLCSASLG